MWLWAPRFSRFDHVMTLKGNEEYCFEEILLKEFWSTLMISDPYEKIEKEKLEENGCNKEIGVA